MQRALSLLARLTVGAGSVSDYVSQRPLPPRSHHPLVDSSGPVQRERGAADCGIVSGLRGIIGWRVGRLLCLWRGLLGLNGECVERYGGEISLSNWEWDNRPNLVGFFVTVCTNLQLWSVLGNNLQFSLSRLHECSLLNMWRK